MNTTLTSRQLLGESANEASGGPSIEIEADVPLDGARVAILTRLLVSDKTLAGLEVIAPDGKVLGIIPRAAVRTYLKSQPLQSATRGGSIDRLFGSPTGDIPLFRCDQHDPPAIRLAWAAGTEPPACRKCCKPMVYVK